MVGWFQSTTPFTGTGIPDPLPTSAPVVAVLGAEVVAETAADTVVVGTEALAPPTDIIELLLSPDIVMTQNGHVYGMARANVDIRQLDKRK